MEWPKYEGTWNTSFQFQLSSFATLVLLDRAPSAGDNFATVPAIYLPALCDKTQFVAKLCNKPGIILPHIITTGMLLSLAWIMRKPKL